MAFPEPDAYINSCWGCSVWTCTPRAPVFGPARGVGRTSEMSQGKGESGSEDADEAGTHMLTASSGGGGVEVRGRGPRRLTPASDGPRAVSSTFSLAGAKYGTTSLCKYSLFTCTQETLIITVIPQQKRKTEPFRKTRHNDSASLWNDPKNPGIGATPLSLLASSFICSEPALLSLPLTLTPDTGRADGLSKRRCGEH